MNDSYYGMLVRDTDEFKKRRDEEYLPQQVKDWWYSLSESQKSFWIKRAEMERNELVRRCNK